MMLPDKIPADFSGTAYNIPLFDHSDCKEPWCVGATIAIYTSDGEPGFHRVFVYCPCGNKIPAGRYHQHAPACKTPLPVNPLFLHEKIIRLREHGRTWQEITKWEKIEEPWVYIEVISGLDEDTKTKLREGEIEFAELVVRSN